jgi:N6-L-threonylcarbamoyladenine synthase
MLVLGVESSCDETAAAVVDDSGLVRSDVVHSQVRLHAAFGGVVPELASRDHLRNVGPVIREALMRAGLTVDDLDAVAVTHRPGLVGALLVGVQAAKGIAWAAGKPLIGVDHLMGHLLAVFLRRPGAEPSEAAVAPPRWPYVSLLASGGHTAIYRLDGPRPEDAVELGATRDDAAGEAFDKVAKLLGLGYPGGPAVERAALGGDPERQPMQAPMAHSTSLEMSFSGIKTQVAQRIMRRADVASDADVRDMCAAFQAAVTGVLSRKVVAAAVREGVRDIVLGGGVAANGELRRRTTELGAARGLRVLVPPLASCTDNAAMIAYAGARRYALEGPGALAGWDLAAESRTALTRATRKGGGRR